MKVMALVVFKVPACSTNFRYGTRRVVYDSIYIGSHTF